MANEIKLTYTAGLTTITVDVFSSNGATQRGDGIAMSDAGHAGLYLGDCASIRTGDIEIFYEGSLYLTGQVYQEIGWSIVDAAGEDALVIAVCNQSLGLLGAEEISGDEQTTRNYLLCETFYPKARDEILAAHKWNFAKKRVFAIQTTDPLFGYDNAFTKPSDCLKVWRIADDNAATFEVEGDLILTDEGETAPDWATATDYIAGRVCSNDDVTYTCTVAHTSGDDDEEPGTGANWANYWDSESGDYKYLETEYVYQATDVSSYPPFLEQCVVINLAIKLSSPIKQNEKVALNLQTMLYGGPKVYGLMSQARSYDAQEGGGAVIKTQTWLDARK